MVLDVLCPCNQYVAHSPLSLGSRWFYQCWLGEGHGFEHNVLGLLVQGYMFHIPDILTHGASCELTVQFH